MFTQTFEGYGQVRRGAVLWLCVLIFVGASSLFTLAQAEDTSVVLQISVGGKPTCSGEVVLMGGERWLITAAHCLNALAPDDTLDISEGAVLKGDQVAARTGHLEVKVADAIILKDFDVSLWRLAFWQLTRTQTLIPRLTELKPDEVVRAAGYPRGMAQTLPCRNLSGNLVTVDGTVFQPVQSLTCANPLGRLGGLSGGPALDRDGRFVGVVSYQGEVGQIGFARVGVVPYRVFKPYPREDGSIEWGALRYGFTFKDYLSQADSSTTVHVRYARRPNVNQIRTTLRTIEIRTYEYAAKATSDDAAGIEPRLNFTLVGHDGRVRTSQNEVLNFPSYLSVRTVLTRLRD